MRKEIRDFKVFNKQLINDNFILLSLQSNDKIPEILPGQFAEILIETKNVFLRRPFSVHDVDYDNNLLIFLVQIIGTGTQYISNLNIGDNLNLIFPLGNSFSVSDKYKDVLIIAGGCGIAPMLLLSKSLFKNNIKPKIILGARSKQHLLRTDAFETYADLFYTTEDGSYGEKGYVINHSLLWKDIKFDFIYSCGPESMLKAVAKYAAKRNINCEVSLENLMACGIGACLCCVTKTIEGHKCVCTDGPVFNTSQLEWNN